MDHSDTLILEAIQTANKFNYWMYETIAPYCNGKTLEIGSGIGNISKFFLQEEKDIALSDYSEKYCQVLEKQFEEYSQSLNVFQIDLAEKQFSQKFADHQAEFDSVFALNVIEHIEDDHQAIQNIHSLLKPEGHIVILVPAYQWLFGSLDEIVDHHRRYNKKTLAQLLEVNGFDLVHKQYFNFMGIFPWWFVSKVLKRKIIKKDQMKLYNILVPFFKLVDKIMFNSAGLSVICVGKKR
ncbi:MAG: class I SAM-dependent methyltransferase [Aureispira sp.]|nr:class I SAM-dependent methyltransferase [Aureispira sp.]